MRRIFDSGGDIADPSLYIGGLECIGVTQSSPLSLPAV